MAQSSIQLPGLELKLAEMTQVRMSKKAHILTLPEWRKLDFQKPFWLQGPSGSGKNFVGAQASKPFFDIDLVGVRDEKSDTLVNWFTDVEKFKEKFYDEGKTLLLGTSDNTLDIQREVDLEPWDSGFVLPQYDLFLEMQRAKYDSYKNKDKNPEWTKFWLAKSKLSRREWGKYYTDKFSEYLKRLSEAKNIDQIYIILNAHTGKKVVHGWFQDASNSENQNANVK